MRSVQAPTPAPRPRRAAPGLALVLCATLAGCDWLNRPAGDPRRESNYQDALRWTDQGRWDTARESFYRALETNPQNLFAHLALGDLYRSRLTNQVLALYHYHRYLELGRAQNQGEFRDQSAADGIRNAEVELARRYAERMFRDQQQHELDSLRQTNAVLVQRIDSLNHHISLLNRQLQFATNGAGLADRTSPQPYPSQQPQAQPQPQGRTAQPAQPQADPRRTTPLPPTTPTPAPATRSHRIQAGDNLSTLSRQYRVTVQAIQAANPGLDPRRLRPGQVIQIPASPR